MRRFCGAHQDMMGKAVKRAGLARYVNAANARAFTARWLKGVVRKDELDPFVILMLELTAKAQRMGLRHESAACPLCAIVKIEGSAPTAHRARIDDVDQVVVDGMMREVIVPLMHTNGRKAA